MLFRRLGRPGLIGLAARTAVVAGTAAAITGGMRRRRYDREREDEAVQQAAAVSAAQPPTAPIAIVDSAGSASGLLGQVNQLARLHTGGVLSDAEFTRAKAKLLG